MYCSILKSVELLSVDGFHSLYPICVLYSGIFFCFVFVFCFLFVCLFFVFVFVLVFFFLCFFIFNLIVANLKSAKISLKLSENVKITTVKHSVLP